MSTNQSQVMDTKEVKLNKLFSPLKIGEREVKNRIVSSSHAVGFDHGLLTERHLRYHERKAEGGTGLVMTFGSASVYKESSASYGSVSLWDPRNEPFLIDLAKRVQVHGALIMSQATHMGRRGSSIISGRSIQAPSAHPEPVHREISHVLRTEEIQPIIDAFADAAATLERCGWDGMEITAFGGHLIEQFWSPVINDRTDRYGGDFEGRNRFAVEVLQAVRAAVSSRFIISFRMAGDPKEDEIGLNQEDMLEIAIKLDELKCIDFFNISGGTGTTYASQTAFVPGDNFKRGTYNHLTRRMKEHLSVPVLVAGRILDPVQAEEALENEDCDLVAMTRAIIADPDLPKLAQEGRLAEIRPCIACNESCIGRIYSGMPMICTVNPSVEKDVLDEIGKAKNIHQVVVIGGGPAGMEAARVAANRGHKVLLIEKGDRLGGKVKIASIVDGRPHYAEHVKWLEKELKRLGVEVRLHEEVNMENLVSMNPDQVIVATGAITSAMPEIGHKGTTSLTDVDLLSGKVTIKPNSKVLVYDREGRYRGTSIANHIAGLDVAHVEVATPMWSVSEDLDEIQKAVMYRLMAKLEVKLNPNKNLIVKDDQAVLKDIWSGSEETLEDYDYIVFVGYEQGDNALYEHLTSLAPNLNIQLIGDALSPRRLNNAILEGAEAGRVV